MSPLASCSRGLTKFIGLFLFTLIISKKAPLFPKKEAFYGGLSVAKTQLSSFNLIKLANSELFLLVPGSWSRGSEW
jgi:hypothetical protein